MPACLCWYEMAYEERQSLLWRLGDKEKGGRDQWRQGKCMGGPPPGGGEAKGGSRFILHKLHPGRLVALILGDHADLGVNPSPATS